MTTFNVLATLGYIVFWAVVCVFWYCTGFRHGYKAAVTDSEPSNAAARRLAEVAESTAVRLGKIRDAAVKLGQVFGGSRDSTEDNDSSDATCDDIGGGTNGEVR